MGKKSGGKWRTGRSEGKIKAHQLLTKSLVPAFLSGNPELKTMLQVEDAVMALRHLKMRREPSISGPGPSSPTPTLRAFMPIQFLGQSHWILPGGKS